MAGQPQQIAVKDLDLSQLSEVRKQLDEELNHLSSSFAQLKQAQAKFKVCADSVGEIKPENTDKTILVPLTNSLYVPGKLCNPDNVIVDVGTGYFVQKSRPEALKYFNVKVEYIRINLEALHSTIEKKQDDMNYIVGVMQSKIQAQTAN